MLWILKSLLTVSVGVCALTVLDAQLGNLTQEQFMRLFRNKWLRGMTLFGAAYAANGNHAAGAVIAVYLYFMLTSYDDVFDMLGGTAEVVVAPADAFDRTDRAGSMHPEDDGAFVE